MKIIVLARTLPMHSIGGMQAIVWDLLKVFAQKDISVTVITTHISGRPSEFFVDGVQVVPVRGTRPEVCDGRWERLSKQTVKKMLQHQVPDIIFSVSSAASAILPLKEEYPRLRFIFQAHGTSWGEVQSKWRTGRIAQYVKSAKNLIGFVKDARYYRAVDRVVAISDLLVQQLKAFPTGLICPSSKVLLIRNGIDEKLFRYEQSARLDLTQRIRWPSSEPIFIFVARLHAQKGVLRVLEIFERFRACFGRGRLIIVGAGEDEAELERRLRKTALESFVYQVGAVPREQLPYYLSAADAFLFPNLRAEGVTMNVMEALACGLPVLCSNAMKGPETGLPLHHLDPFDSDAWVAAMSSVSMVRRASESLLPPSMTLGACADEYMKLFRLVAEE